jgi:hypothetical protein
MKNKIIIIGLLIFLMINLVNALVDCTGVNPITCYPDNDLVVFKGSPSTVCNQTCGISVGYQTQLGYSNPSYPNCNCDISNNLVNSSRGYWNFKNITQMYQSVVFICVADWRNAPNYCQDELANTRLYRFYGGSSWTESTLTWTNQPVLCTDLYGVCYGSDLIEIDAPTYSSCIPNTYSWNVYSWNLSQTGLYGGAGETDWNNINLMLFWTNSSSNGSMGLKTYPLGYLSGSIPNAYCHIEFANPLANVSLITVNTAVNGEPKDGVLVTICNQAGECTSKLSSSYKAIFTMLYGIYTVNASYCGSSYIYPYPLSIYQPDIELNPFFNAPGCPVNGTIGSISGLVYWWNDTALNNYAMINIYNNVTHSLATYLSNSDGSFNITSITKGHYFINATYSYWNTNTIYFSCTGDDSINLELIPLGLPESMIYTLINVSTFQGSTTPLGSVTLQLWDCDESCFNEISCRNSPSCFKYVPADKTTNSNGYATYNFMPPNEAIRKAGIILYGYKYGYVDDYQSLSISTNYTYVELHLELPPNITVMMHEENNLSNIRVRLTPNIGASQTNYTNNEGYLNFTFTAPFTSLILNATLTGYLPSNRIYGQNELAGNLISLSFSMNPLNNSMNVIGYCLDDLNIIAYPVNITLLCMSCQHTVSGGVSYECSSITTDSLGRYAFNNMPFSAGTCWLRSKPLTTAYYVGGLMSFTPILGTKYINFTNPTPCVLNTNATLSGLIKIDALVTEGSGRGQNGLTIMEGSYNYIVNNSLSLSRSFSNGYVFIDNLVPSSNVSITFTTDNYEHKQFFIALGNNHFTNPNFFVLDWIGGSSSQASSSQASSSQSQASSSQASSSQVSSSQASSSQATTTTLYEIYTPSNETTGLLTNAYNYIIYIATAICGAIGSVLLFIVGFIGVLIILFANKVLNALGWKWSWFGLGD